MITPLPLAAPSVVEDDGRLLLTLAPPSPPPASPWDLLAANHALPGNTRWAAVRAGAPPYLAAELLDAGAEREARVAEALRGMEAAAAGAGVTILSSGGAAADSALLAALCRESGWPFQERDRGVIAVALESRSGVTPHTALARALAADCVEVRAQLAHFDAGALAPASRAAIGCFLLACSARLRAVRPAVESTLDRIELFVEARFAPMPSALELAEAFAACSVACDACAAEVDALASEGIAREYLAAVKPKDLSERTEPCRTQS